MCWVPSLVSRDIKLQIKVWLCFYEHIRDVLSVIKEMIVEDWGEKIYPRWLLIQDSYKTRCLRCCKNPPPWFLLEFYSINWEFYSINCLYKCTVREENAQYLVPSTKGIGIWALFPFYPSKMIWDHKKILTIQRISIVERSDQVQTVFSLETCRYFAALTMGSSLARDCY